ncbi:hypothetical protein H7F15_09015 [Pontibacter sp. Tf4]|uniref:hypothetical protein n=1 Tax=Pontibacter sp. Tf4 TaxID=2761620 RepID=UPI001626E3FC|nr:hypothetical protein [Pontibacter sp. Tf4]MBB6611175.1 hypothetical protein [Pontibacter sp. Tf4]
MVRFLRFLVLLLFTLPALAQEPAITWGPEIPQRNRNLNYLQLIGPGNNNTFYTRYTQTSQVTLEHYSGNGQRLWAVAIAPLDPAGNRATFEDLILLNHQVYLLSSRTERYKKEVYIQQIDLHGNYMPAIHLLGTTTPDATIYTQTKDGRLILILQQQAEPQQTIVSSFQGSFTLRWQVSLPVKGEVQQTEVTEAGTAYILTRLPATNSPEAAFFLYRFEGRNGSNAMQAIGSTAQRPLQAKLGILNGDVIVAGTTAPAPFVASLQPEPTGTFFYRIPKGRLRRLTLNYSPIDSLFLQNYKAYKPDQDHSQRLRHLQLQQLLPLPGNRTALLGEVTTTSASDRHTDDILITTFAANGAPQLTTSVNKHQAEAARAVQLSSYIATTEADTIKLIYLDFEYNYNEQNEIIMASPRAILKTPVLVTIAPDGKQRVRPLRRSQTGRHQDFYLVPSAAYKLSRQEFIVLGSGKGYYKFGRLKF